MEKCRKLWYLRNKLTRNEEWSMPYNPWLLIAQGVKDYNSVNTKVSETPKICGGLIRGSD